MTRSKLPCIWRQISSLAIGFLLSLLGTILLLVSSLSLFCGASITLNIEDQHPDTPMSSPLCHGHDSVSRGHRISHWRTWTIVLHLFRSLVDYRTQFFRQLKLVRLKILIELKVTDTCSLPDV